MIHPLVPFVVNSDIITKAQNIFRGGRTCDEGKSSPLFMDVRRNPHRKHFSPHIAPQFNSYELQVRELRCQLYSVTQQLINQVTQSLSTPGLMFAFMESGGNDAALLPTENHRVHREQVSGSCEHQEKWSLHPEYRHDEVSQHTLSFWKIRVLLPSQWQLKVSGKCFLLEPNPQ